MKYDGPGGALSHVKALKKCIQYTFNKKVDFLSIFVYTIIVKGRDGDKLNCKPSFVRNGTLKLGNKCAGNFPKPLDNITEM